MKKTSNELLKRMEMLLAMNMNYCSNCGSERVEVQFKDLPDAPKKGFTELMNIMPDMKGDSFLYCKHCDEYSFLSSHFV